MHSPEEYTHYPEAERRNSIAVGIGGVIVGLVSGGLSLYFFSRQHNTSEIDMVVGGGGIATAAIGILGGGALFIHAFNQAPKLSADETVRDAPEPASTPPTRQRRESQYDSAPEPGQLEQVLGVWTDIGQTIDNIRFPLNWTQR